MSSATSSTKASLRRAALARRDALDEAQRAAAAQALAARTLPFAVAGTVVAGYAPVRSEIDPRPLMQALAEGGARLALPVITGRDLPLVFRAWTAGDDLEPGPFGILQPRGAAPEVSPHIVLVPLAAFDRAGHRIGYGAGHYDRTLAPLRARKPIIAVGLAFAAQEIAAVPADGHDARLDLVLTEKATIDLRS